MQVHEGASNHFCWGLNDVAAVLIPGMPALARYGLRHRRDLGQSQHYGHRGVQGARVATLGHPHYHEAVLGPREHLFLL